MDPFHFPSPPKPRVKHEVVLRRAQHVISPEAFSVELFQPAGWHLLHEVWPYKFAEAMPRLAAVWHSLTMPVPNPVSQNKPKAMIAVPFLPQFPKIVLLTCLCGSLPKHSTDRFAWEFVTKIIPCLKENLAPRSNKHVSLSTTTLCSFFLKMFLNVLHRYIYQPLLFMWNHEFSH